MCWIIYEHNHNFPIGYAFLINSFIKSLPEGLDSIYNKIDDIKVIEKNITNMSNDIKSKYLIEVDKNIAKI